MHKQLEKKLCYYYDEKYELRLKCKKRNIFLLKGVEGDDTIEEKEDEADEAENIEELVVSLNALA